MGDLQSKTALIGQADEMKLSVFLITLLLTF